jgi:hypothetical protein
MTITKIAITICDVFVDTSVPVNTSLVPNVEIYICKVLRVEFIKSSFISAIVLFTVSFWEGEKNSF